MAFDEVFYIFLGGSAFGLFLAYFLDYSERKLLLRKTKIEGEDILQEVQEKSEALYEKHQKSFDSFQEKNRKIFEKEKEKRVSVIREIQAQLDKKKHQLTLKQREREQFLGKINNQLSDLRRQRENEGRQREQFAGDIKQYIKNKIEKIENHFSISLPELKEELKKDIAEEWQDKVGQELEKKTKQKKENLKKEVYFYLNTVLNRFDRIYCPERGISPVSFGNIQQLNKVMGPDRALLSKVEKECGVDILVNEEDLQASIFGIDPVRRELGRITLKRLSKKHKIDSSLVEQTVKKSKKDLFAQIRRDGQSICQRLNLKNVHPEVKNMMGALRYRYSFAQNQYFHCEEVGWLCGLLNSELDLPIKRAQRSGMYHDIGKAMDHSIEGNHAVIGAEFLSKYKESKEVLHAVRAHHHDETPSTALAYLVIVADSISGSRPGARRSTEDSYNQKMATLERIIDSFKDIEDAYIMSAGREMRVIVDNNKVSDKGALDLSRQIARKIEKECSYPGLIKVTVVRHSEKVAMA